MPAPETPSAVHSASFAELEAPMAYRLWALRESVFVVEQDCPYQELDGRDLEPATRHLWCADDAGEPTAYLRVLQDGETARIGRVLTRPDHRGRGLAAELMHAAHAEIGERPVVLDAQAHLVDWYAALGYAPSGRGFVEDGIPHLSMRRG
ncbi:MAG: GNAT family N-acetyltransferase [Micrococcales bacterium]|nr:GNAT family N-acetyltransferase [Micrococcales bacterium]